VIESDNRAVVGDLNTRTDTNYCLLKHVIDRKEASHTHMKQTVTLNYYSNSRLTRSTIQLLSSK